MPTSSHDNPFAEWLRTHAVPLTHLDPEASLDDLEPLRATTGHTADMPRDENTRFGFTIDATALEPAEPGSVEAAFSDAELGLSIADFHQAHPPACGNADLAPGPDRIRIQSAYLHTPVLEAFDAILHTPTSTVADNLDDM
ncbi:hypothetical protein ACFVT2_18725 [Streptomyces sp. NPDC058000]|uniref:hypothetical protein n=1 Tax=Streptomyces sp. NPDC058000 TaxID=3346299 RepID=UPI0036E7FE11